MRSLVAQAILTDAQLRTLGVTEEALHAGDVDTPPTRPFVQLRWDETGVGIGAVDTRRLVVWAHDEPNDYERIDAILRRIRVVLTALEAVQTTHGWLTLVEWNGNSPDLADDGHGTITRNSTFTLVGSGV